MLRHREALIREPSELIAYLVRNDRPFSELVSADYIMVSPYTARGYGIFDEIKARFAPHWVLISEPQTDEQQRVRASKVLFHSPEREEVYWKAIELRPGHFAFRYLGELPEDMACPSRRSERAFAAGSN